MKTITIINEVVPRYRVPFFEGLSRALQHEGVRLQVAHGEASGQFALRRDSGLLAGSLRVPQRNLTLGTHELVWLETSQIIESSDLIIATQEIRQLQNLALWGKYKCGRLKLAWWGHGRDFSKSPASWSESIKRYISRHAHWWFAYNGLSARVVRELGYPSSRITPVMNAVNTRPLKMALDRIQEAEVLAIRKRMGIQGDYVGLYIGALAPIKGLPFLLDACRVIRSKVPNFEIIVMGSGPEEQAIHTFAAEHPWFHVLPPCFDEEKAPYLKLADLFLMPVGVGLGILDTFVAECPLLTTDHPGHGPEIDYLQQEVNGRQVTGRPSAEAYGQAVANLLSDPPALARLREGCQISAGVFSLEAMVANFSLGVLQALEAPPFRRGTA